jgi:chromosome segregation ATPase
MRQEERLSVDPVSPRGLRSPDFGERMGMTGLTDAAARLSAALDRLEIVLTPLSEAQKRHARDAAEIASLAQEREGLLARIAELEEENRALASETEEVEVRLDGAIAEIRSALGR